MKYFLVLLCLALSQNSFAKPPVVWSSSCASGIFNLANQSCLGGGPGGVSSVTGAAPVVSSGGANPAISMAASTSSVNGYLASADWVTFNAKQAALTFSAPLVNTSGTISIPVATGSVNGYLASADWTTFNGKQASGSYITALTGDVTASGPGSVAAAVALVGGSSAANVHSAELAANAATNANTVSKIVKRDASGNFAAGAITLNGHILSHQGVAPTAAVQASAGTGASCSVAHATDNAGQISITTGSGSVSTGAYCIVSFNAAYGVAPICSLTAAGSMLSTSVYVTSTVNDTTANFAGPASTGTTYLLNYSCIETQ